MDVVNTKIGQDIARESASVLNEKSFVSSSLVGYATGVSQYTKSENAAVAQQVKSTDKTQIKLSEESKSQESKKLKANSDNADTLTREDSISLSESLTTLSGQLQTNGTKLSFTLNEDADRPIVIVMDQESGSVIRQIPSEEVLKFAERVKELESGSSSKTGLVFDKQA